MLGNPKPLMDNLVKKIIILLFIILTFIFSTTFIFQFFIYLIEEIVPKSQLQSQSWGEWIYVLENQNGGKSYYDKDRLRKSGNYIYFWELLDFTGKNDTVGFMSYIQLDCSVFRIKKLKSQNLTNPKGEGEIKGDFTSPDEWYYPPPKSITERFYNKVCEEHQ